jgi:hypothetical protein
VTPVNAAVATAPTAITCSSRRFVRSESWGLGGRGGFAEPMLSSAVSMAAV